MWPAVRLQLNQFNGGFATGSNKHRETDREREGERQIFRDAEKFVKQDRTINFR